jgi:hypothetical protein
MMFFGSLPDHLILFPTRAPIDAGSAARQTVPFENGELEVWTAKSRRALQQGHADIFILRFYGNADRADRWAAAETEMWSDRAVEIWGMNYPGFGGSTGPARLSQIGPAAVAIFDELKRHAASNGPVESAVPSGSILQNPPPLREMILRQFGWWNLWLLAGPIASQVPRDLDSIENAKAIHAPAIFLLAQSDEVVAPRFHRLVVNAYAGEKRVIELHGAYHNDPIDSAALADLNNAFDWLLKVSSPRGL